MASPSDPIRNNYYRPLEHLEAWSRVLFFVTAVLSFVILFLGHRVGSQAYEVIKIGFILCVIILFLLEQIVRLYLFYRATNKRRQDFVSHAYGISLLDERTDGYYTNDQSNPIKRLAAQLLENTLFSKRIASRMSRSARFKIGFYFCVWLVCALYRQFDLEFVIILTQILFSEQVLSRWLRIEWFRARVEAIYDGLYQLFQTAPSQIKFQAMVVDAYGAYETAKTNAGITLSEKIFLKLKSSLEEEWDGLRKSMRL